MATKIQAVKNSQEPLIDALERALRHELALLSKAKVGEDSATLTDKMKVFDRVLKLVAIKAKLDGEEDGAFFKDDPDGQ